MNMTKKEKAAWSSYFSALVGWSMHPGYYRDNATKPTLEECADKADQMVLVSREHFRPPPAKERPTLKKFS